MIDPVQSLITKRIKPVLIGRGFEGDMGFSSHRDWCVDLFEIQKSSAIENRFTINLGVSVKQIEEVVWGSDYEVR